MGSFSISFAQAKSALLLFLIIGIAMKSVKAESKFKSKCSSLYYNAPKCIDHPDGYGCECGSGFHWNTEMCMSTAIDSRLEFKHKTPIRYTLLLGKAFPQLRAFTVTFWIRLYDETNGTVLSYKDEPQLDLFRLDVGRYLSFKLWDTKVPTNIKLSPGQWHHVTWTWTSTDGSWSLFLNATKQLSGRNEDMSRILTAGGEIVLGQASRKKFEFNSSDAFVGDLAHLHIWNFVMSGEDMRSIYQSCTFMYCGNAAQWADFRSGTRGAMKMRWPSGIVDKQCYTERKSKTCNKYCSDAIGAQCNKDTVRNIVWDRTKANVYLNVSCPGQDIALAQNQTVENATRLCSVTEHNDGKWEIPMIDKCITTELRALKEKFKEDIKGENTTEKTVLDLLEQLLNHTSKNVYFNPIDVATVIELLDMIVQVQNNMFILKEKVWIDGTNTYAKTEQFSPSMEETRQLSQIFVDTVDNLVARKNDVGWNSTKPPGVEGDNLLRMLEQFTKIIAKSMEYHLREGNLKIQNAYIFEAKEYIEFKTEAFYADRFVGSSFPKDNERKLARMPSSHGYVQFPDVFKQRNMSTSPATIQISYFRFKDIGKHLPNHDQKIKSKEDNVNTPVVAVYVYNGDSRIVHNLSSPIIYKLSFLNTFNISNPECVRMRHGVNYFNLKEKVAWTWLRDGCYLNQKDEKSATCACYVPGVFAITTDMYDVNWDKGEKRPILMNAASYLGCALSALLCLATIAVHVYCKTSSIVASLHKSLAVSIFLSQLVFMIGIERYEHKIVCQVFAILIHYFSMSTYSWLMNETFNLYTSVTYSAHGAHSDLSDAGSLLRYNILGWIIPGVLVGAFVGSQGDSYYAKDMCWIAWDNLWLFVGPTLGIVAVTIMVLIFTAKEHNENSYTKSEKTNKIIMVHMKGLWTQIILVTVNWSFAFLSLKMQDSIIKYLYAMMNVLQASFFAVFNLLHAEIRDVLKSKEKIKTLTVQGTENEERSDSYVSSPLVEKDTSEVLTLEKRKPGRSLPTEKRRLVGATSDDDLAEKGSDCEMITSL